MAKRTGAAQPMRRRKRRGSIYVPVAVVILVIALFFGMSTFFNVSNIEVTGIENYTEEEVIAASGIGLGKNIFFLDEDGAAQKIYEALPYMDDIQITKKLPDTVVIEASECYRLASIEYEGAFWIINKNGKILEKTDAAGAQDTIQIKGLEPIQPALGDKVALGEAGTLELGYMTEILNAVVKFHMEDDITWLDMSNVGGITLDYLDRFVVELGKGENAEIKLNMLLNVVENLEDSDSGRIDISTENEAHFMPD